MLILSELMWKLFWFYTIMPKNHASSKSEIVHSERENMNKFLARLNNSMQMKM